MRLRVRLVRTAGAFKNRVHAVLADHGVVIETDTLWTKPGRRGLPTSSLPPLPAGSSTTASR